MTMTMMMRISLMMTKMTFSLHSKANRCQAALYPKPQRRLLVDLLIVQDLPVDRLAPSVGLLVGLQALLLDPLAAVHLVGQSQHPLPLSPRNHLRIRKVVLRKARTMRHKRKSDGRELKSICPSLKTGRVKIEMQQYLGLSVKWQKDSKNVRS